MGLAVFVLWFICWCKKIALCSRSTFLPLVLVQLLLSGHTPRNPATNSREQNPDQFPIHLFRSWCQSQHLAKTQFQLGWLLRSGETVRSFSAYSHSSSGWNQKHTSSPSIPTPFIYHNCQGICPCKSTLVLSLHTYGILSIHRDSKSIQQLLANISHSRPGRAAVLGMGNTSHPQHQWNSVLQAFFSSYMRESCSFHKEKQFFPWNYPLDFQSRLLDSPRKQIYRHHFLANVLLYFFKFLLYHSLLPQWGYCVSFRSQAFATIIILGSHLFSPM